MQSRSQFGRLETGPVYFNIRSTGDRREAWRGGGPQVRWFTIPGSNPPKRVGQVPVILPATATWRLYLSSEADLQALAAKQGAEDELIIPHRIQSHAGTVIPGVHTLFVKLPFTILETIENEASLSDGGFEVDATFSRLLDPATGLGVAAS